MYQINLQLNKNRFHSPNELLNVVPKPKTACKIILEQGQGSAIEIYIKVSGNGQLLYVDPTQQFNSLRVSQEPYKVMYNKM